MKISGPTMLERSLTKLGPQSRSEDPHPDHCSFPPGVEP